MRRTQTEADLIIHPTMSPIKDICEDLGVHYVTETLTKNSYGIYFEDEKEPRGIGLALSTIKNLRGFSGRHISLLIYDEFIPEGHASKIKNEASAFFNAYETINRNRELTGDKPLQAICMANSNDLANPIYVELELVLLSEKLKKQGKEQYINPQRGISFFNLDSSPISDLKSQTALYKLQPKENIFTRMALKNEFNTPTTVDIRNIPIKELTPFLRIGEICCYKHKSETLVYVTSHISGTYASISPANEDDKIRLRREYSWLWNAYVLGYIIFETIYCQILFTKSFN